MLSYPVRPLNTASKRLGIAGTTATICGQLPPGLAGNHATSLDSGSVEQPPCPAYYPCSKGKDMSGPKSPLQQCNVTTYSVQSFTAVQSPSTRADPMTSLVAYDMTAYRGCSTRALALLTSLPVDQAV